MTLAPGTRLGPYELVAPIGAGGMGEVYRARDSRLDRDVAIKVLPGAVATDPDRQARFEREAKAIAALSHPNILAIFDTGTAGGKLFVVTELLDGETLRDRLTHALPVRKAVDIAIQIARGLAAAHDKSIVHRDLKPENVFLTTDGHIKILDFGLARQASTNTGATATMSAMTDPGTVMGTVGYMAPEQVRGQTVDARTDLFALGAVLYEMLTGRRAFQRDTPPETMTAILREDLPALESDGRGEMSPALDRIVRHCLEKHPNERFQSARDVAFALEALSGSVSSTPSSSQPSPPQSRAWRWLRRSVLVPWLVSATAAVVLVVFLRSPQPEPAADPVLVSIAVPAYPWIFELSPNGRRLASTGYRDGKLVVWVREMDSLDIKTLPGSEDASGVFWFPDSQSVGFLSHEKLQRASVSGGPPTLIADHLGGNFEGASANHQGIVLFSPTVGQGPLYRTSPNGAEPATATVLNQERGETAHRWPQFLPDDVHFIYLASSRQPGQSGIYVGRLDSNETRLLVRTDVKALFAPPEFLMFVRDRALMGQRFDLRTATLRGDAHPLADIVSVFPSAGAAAITASATALVYRDADELAIRNSQLLWITRLGSIVGKIGEVADYSTINLSRDDKKLAIALRGQTTKNLDLWIGDVERGITSPFVVGASGNFDPQWSPTSEIAFSSDRNGASSIFRKSSTGRGDPSEVVQQGEAVMVSDWSRDGRFLLYQSASGERVFAAAVDVHPPKPSLFIESPTAKDQLHFSPDGQWVAYGGNDAGRFEVFVVGFPIAGQPIRVSVDGGVQPRWRSDGKELFYLKQDGTMMAVAVRVPGSGAIEFGEPRALFRTGLSSPAWDIEQYDVTADGQRFIIITPPNESTGKFMNLLLNWRLRLE